MRMFRRFAALLAAAALLVGAGAPGALADETPPTADPPVIAETAPEEPAPPEPRSVEPAPEESPPAAPAADEPAAEGVPETVAAAAPCTITSATVPWKAPGAATNMWGTTSGCPEGAVVAEVLVDDGWVPVGEAPHGGEGFFVVPPGGVVDGPGTHTLRATVAGVPSEPTTLRRFGAPTVFTAGVKPVGQVTNTWGRFDTDVALQVWTEVELATGWSRSQVRTTDAAGAYVIPLTYGAHSPGVHRWRVAGRYPDGSVARTEAFSLRRHLPPTFTTAGTKLVGLETNGWGRFPDAPGIRVWTEVRLDTGWSKSQERRTDATGYFVIPLTYGWDVAGTYRWRVVGEYPDGSRVSTREATLTRTVGAQPVITRTTTGEVAGHWGTGCPVGPARLSTLRVNHRTFDGGVARGEIIVRQDLAAEVAEVFAASFDAGFRIEQMRLPGVWDGDDVAMMAANNTSGFNCRKVVGNPYAWSPHAYGISVDINPAQNPYRDPSGRWYPNAQYATSRPAGVTGMLYPDSAPVRAFGARGWSWESGWDWHHFQKRN